MSAIILNEENFEKEVLESRKPVIVDFFAEWCGPCQMMAPIIEQMADEIKDIAKVGKVNSDENVKLVEKYKIESIPTIIIFKNGEIDKIFVGVTSKNIILESLK